MVFVYHLMRRKNLFEQKSAKKICTIKKNASIFVARSANNLLHFYMGSINYEAAIITLIQANQGILPALSKWVWVDISTESGQGMLGITVGELLTLALTQIQASAGPRRPVVEEAPTPEPAAALAPARQPLGNSPKAVAKLAQQATTGSLN